MEGLIPMIISYATDAGAIPGVLKRLANFGAQSQLAGGNACPTIKGLRTNVGRFGLSIPMGRLEKNRRRQQAWSVHYAQTKVLGERIEVPVAVQQIIPALDASGCNHGIDGLANVQADAA
jgi:hypothetical protein